MLGPLGVPELLFILVLALLIFGPRRLPEVGRTVGKALGEFRRASNDLRRTLNTEIALDELEQRPAHERRPARTVETPPGGAAGAVGSGEAPRIAPPPHPGEPRSAAGAGPEAETEEPDGLGGVKAEASGAAEPGEAPPAPAEPAVVDGDPPDAAPDVAPADRST
jgi:TatA/E family protein of Tat protein translocase